MSDRHQLKQRLGWSLAALALVATPSFGSAPHATASVNTGAVMAVAAAAPSATAATRHRSHGSRGYHQRSHGYRGHYGHRGYYSGYRYGGYRHYGYGYYGYPYYGYGHRYGYGPTRNLRYRASQVEQLGALDFDVKPKRAEIFLDGRSIGTVGQFDGFPDYLWLEKGTYDVTVFLDGYQSLERTYRVYPGLVIDVDGRLAAGASTRPEEPATSATSSTAGTPSPQSPPPGRLVEPAPMDGSKGRLTVLVSPADAAVYLDGHFLGVAQELEHVSAGLLVDAGQHTIEVARPGYRGVTREVEISAGERFQLSVELRER